MQERGALASLTRPSSSWRRLGLALIVAAVVEALDQLTKSWAMRQLQDGPIHVIGPLDLELARNEGSAFSLTRGGGSVLAVVAAALIVVLVVLAWRARSRTVAGCLGLVIGGALGNLTDRLVRSGSGVVDFIALHFWPTFNVADASIVVGVVCCVVLLWRSPRADSAAPGDGASPPRAEPPLEER